MGSTGHRRAMRWEPIEQAKRTEFHPRRTYLMETLEGTTVTYRSVRATRDELWFWADRDKAYRVHRSDTRKAFVTGAEAGVVACTLFERR